MVQQAVERTAYSIGGVRKTTGVLAALPQRIPRPSNPTVPRLSIGHPRSTDLGAVLERFREVALEVCVNLATTDLGIPVLITLALDNSGAGPATVIAARADLDVEYAILRSLEETA